MTGFLLTLAALLLAVLGLLSGLGRLMEQGRRMRLRPWDKDK